MKTKPTSLHQILLAAGLTLAGFAHAVDLPFPEAGPGMDRPPMAQGGPAGFAGCEPAAHGEGHEAHEPHEGRPGRGPGLEEHGLDMAPRGPDGMMMPMMGAEPPFMHGLELSEAQQDKVFALLHAEAPYLREQVKAARKAQDGLRALSQAAQYDDAKAATLAQAGAQAMSNIALQHLRTEQKLLALLTPEQRKQLAERQSHHSPRS